MGERGRATAAWHRLALGATLVALLAHAWSYRFETDDAFVQFRYARNLADGLGLVFNPGDAPVEGFSSPAWTLVLAGCARAGVEIESAARALSLAATVGLWLALVALGRLTLGDRAAGAVGWIALAAGLLALTRSVAVWSTGGLETRLFECAVAWTIVRLARELEAHDARDAGRVPLGGVLLGLLAWIRPEGLMLTLTIPAALALGLPASKRARLLRALVVALVLDAALLGARYAVFGELLPNTYYAKLDGHTDWQLGRAYVEMFALEYGAAFWLPLVLVGAWSLGTRSAALRAIAGACLPMLVYVAAIGGDHFEYRPLDLLFPYAWLLAALGARRLSRARARRAGPLAAAALVVLSASVAWFLPRATHAHFPDDYRPGFPGLDTSEEARAFPGTLDHPLFLAPGLDWMAARHRRLLHDTSRRFVGLRQEEHAAFFAAADAQARELERLVDEGAVPAELFVALECVGVVPYRSNLRVLDRLGLTDRAIARSEPIEGGLSAHSKAATPEEAARRGVDLWALHPTNLVWDAASSEFQALLRAARAGRQDFGIAEVAPGTYLFGWLPQGLEATRRKWPSVAWRSTLDAN